ncbi:MAG TPA: phosphatase PAP2 family protein [Polyangia bacterium]
MAMGLALDLTIPLHPRVFDPVVMALDGAFGQPSFLVGRVAEKHPALLTLMSLTYLLLPVMMAAIIAVERRRAPGATRDVLRPILLAAAIGYLLYQIYPVVGPEPLLGARFPGGPIVPPGPDRDVLVAALTEPRNCMPSLHVGWALLLYWRGRKLGGVARLATGLWLPLTALATLANGQHYFIDLVVAVPFAALVDLLAERPAPVAAKRARAWLIVTASVSLLAWYATLLLAPTVPPSAPPLIALAAATVAASWTLQARWSAALGLTR